MKSYKKRHWAVASTTAFAALLVVSGCANVAQVAEQVTEQVRRSSLPGQLGLPRTTPNTPGPRPRTAEAAAEAPQRTAAPPRQPVKPEPTTQVATAQTAPQPAPAVRPTPPPPPPVAASTPAPAVVARPLNAIQECDQLAAHPDDPEAFAPGIPSYHLYPEKVIKACEAAVKLDKSSPRLAFQLARGYLSVDRFEDAIEQLLSAAKRGHGGALGFLGDIYLDGGPGIEPNPETARKLYAQAVASGFEPAKKILAEFEDYTERVAAAEKAATTSAGAAPSKATGPQTIPGYANAFTSVYTGPKLTDSKASCLPERQFELRMRAQKYMKAVSALQTFINPNSHRQWLTSSHNIEGETVTGEELDEFLDINTDIDTIYSAEQLMKDAGMGLARIDDETKRMQSYLHSLLRQRFNAIVESKNLFFVYTQGDNSPGLLVTQTDDIYCIADTLTSVDIRNYKSTKRPDWIKPNSNFAKAIEEYQKRWSYGLTAFGRMSNGDTLVVLTSPRHQPGSYGGPLPFFFAGVVLVGNESKDEKPALFGNLMHVQYEAGFHPDHLSK